MSTTEAQPVLPVTPAVSRKMIWAGRIVSVVPVFFLLMSASFKLMRHPQAVEGFAKMGYPAGSLLPLGIVEAACAILYVIPRTAVLGAILITGYLGGATDVHVRNGEQFFMPVFLGVLVWLGLYLRDRRVRALMPLTRP